MPPEGARRVPPNEEFSAPAQAGSYDTSTAGGTPDRSRYGAPSAYARSPYAPYPYAPSSYPDQRSGFDRRSPNGRGRFPDRRLRGERRSQDRLSQNRLSQNRLRQDRPSTAGLRRTEATDRFTSPVADRVRRAATPTFIRPPSKGPVSDRRAAQARDGEFRVIGSLRPVAIQLLIAVCLVGLILSLGGRSEHVVSSAREPDTHNLAELRVQNATPTQNEQFAVRIYLLGLPFGHTVFAASSANARIRLAWDSPTHLLVDVSNVEPLDIRAQEESWGGLHVTYTFN